MAYGTVNADVIQSSVSGVSLGAGNATSFKNRIINGAMVIDQRNAGASVTPATGAYTLDRWCIFASQASKFTIQQNAGSVTPPAGFTNYLGLTVGASASVTVGAGDYFLVEQVIEGFNLADLGWGSASAQTVTVSFWVRSSLTGTFGGSVKAYSGTAYGYPFTYTINSANTWEQKTITITGPTSTWAASTTNGGSAEVIFSVGTGSTYTGASGSWQAGTRFSANSCVNLISTNSATFYITGVQLEVGSSATGFDFRSYGTELALCQRYYFKNGGANQYVRIGTGPAISTTAALITIFMQTPMRAQPSSVTQTGVVAVWAGATVFSVSATSLDSTSTSPYVTCLNCTSSGLTTGTTYQLIGNNDSTASIALSAEL